MFYKKIKLEYDYKSLEPFIDELTMKIHYEKHHGGYENKLNDAVEEYDPELTKKYKNINELMLNYQKISNISLKIAIREYGGGLINHNFFWRNLKKGTKPSEKSALYNDITEKWDSFQEFEKSFKKASMDLFGSGWVWLAINKNKELKIVKTFNQDNPWFLNFKPVIGIDLWEHSYYLKHKNDKKEYIENFFKIINWEFAEEEYAKIMK